MYIKMLIFAAFWPCISFSIFEYMWYLCKSPTCNLANIHIYDIITVIKL